MERIFSKALFKKKKKFDDVSLSRVRHQPSGPVLLLPLLFPFFNVLEHETFVVGDEDAGFPAVPLGPDGEIGRVLPLNLGPVALPPLVPINGLTAKQFARFHFEIKSIPLGKIPGRDNKRIGKEEINNNNSKKK